MTQNGNPIRRVRARAAKTGESYTAALSHIRKRTDEPAPPRRSLRLAVAQTTPYVDPRNVAELAAAGQEIRRLMRQAREGRGSSTFPKAPPARPTSASCRE